MATGLRAEVQTRGAIDSATVIICIFRTPEMNLKNQSGGPRRDDKPPSDDDHSRTERPV